jgi:hypothetical protein
LKEVFLIITSHLAILNLLGSLLKFSKKYSSILFELFVESIIGECEYGFSREPGVRNGGEV